MDKCVQCGKELEAGMVMGEEYIEARRRCPTHGEKGRWKPCPKYGGSIGRNPYVRLCRAVGVRLGPENCAPCRIPEQARKAKLVDKLVEAVKALRDSPSCNRFRLTPAGGYGCVFCEELLPMHGETMHKERCPMALAQAALAAVAEAEKEGSG